MGHLSSYVCQNCTETTNPRQMIPSAKSFYGDTNNLHPPLRLLCRVLHVLNHVAALIRMVQMR